MTRGGGNGDYRIPVYAPASIQEAVDIIYEAPAIADAIRNPVAILADGMLGQMMEPVSLPEQKKQIMPEDVAKYKPWALTGYDHKENHERAVVKSLRLQPDVLEAHVEKLFEKYRKLEKEMVRYETVDIEDADIVFVAFGTMSRLCKEAMEILAESGIKAGLIRPITLWPFPYEAFEQINYDKTKVVISTELSMGQMIEDVKQGISGRLPVGLIHRTGGIIPTSLEVVSKAKEILEGVK
jgi:2-oxoglutarate ferredoxin oxidoreductase subunit alpha